MLIYFIAAALLVVLDQVVKLLVRSSIALGGSVPLIPHVLQLTFVKNTGAAFSSFSGSTFALGVVSAVVSVALIIALVKPFVHHPLGRWPVTLILAGAVGNMIDRFFLGYVTDMFQTLFMNFAVFNVADIWVVVGVFAFAAYVIFGWDRFEPKKEKKDGKPAGEKTDD